MTVSMTAEITYHSSCWRVKAPTKVGEALLDPAGAEERERKALFPSWWVRGAGRAGTLAGKVGNGVKRASKSVTITRKERGSLPKKPCPIELPNEMNSHP